MSFGFDSQDKEFINIDYGNAWPELSTGEFKAHRRIPEQFETQALADSLNRSAAEVQQQLLSSAADKGVTFVLDENRVPQLTDQQISLYRQAVYGRSHADLLSYFATVDHKEDKDIEQQRDGLLASSNRTIRLLLGRGRCGVHLL